MLILIATVTATVINQIAKFKVTLICDVHLKLHFLFLQCCKRGPQALIQSQITGKWWFLGSIFKHFFLSSCVTGEHCFYLIF